MPGPSGSAHVADILKRYPAGRIVTVHYNTDAPSECLLERDSGTSIASAWPGSAALVAWILAGFVVVCEGADWLGASLRSLTERRW